MNHIAQFCDMEKILGDIIRQKIREDGRTAQAICDELGMSRGNLDKIYHKESLNSDLLAKLCGVLDYDFFRHVNPFRRGEVDKVRPFHPFSDGNRVEEDQQVYQTPGNQIEKFLRDLQAADQELVFIRQNLEDLRNSVVDKDEIISLQKDKIAYLQERLDAAQQG